MLLNGSSTKSLRTLFHRRASGAGRYGMNQTAISSRTS